MEDENIVEQTKKMMEKVNQTKEFEEKRGNPCEVHENVVLRSTFQAEKGSSGIKYPVVLAFIDSRDSVRKAYGFTKSGFRVHKWAVPIHSIVKRAYTETEL